MTGRAPTGERCPTCGQPGGLAAASRPRSPDRVYRLKSLPSVYEMREQSDGDRIAAILDFLDATGRRKAQRLTAGMVPSDARRVLDEALCKEKL